MKIVINRCFGGFHLSDKAYERLIELGVPVVKYESKNDRKHGKVIFDRTLEDDCKPSSLFGRYWDAWIDSYSDDHAGRVDPLVVQVVEELGEEASSRFSKLEVVEIPDGIEWEIEEYDGSEHVAEKHRTW